MLAFGWIILAGLACQALFWIPVARDGRTPSRRRILAALAGGLMIAVMAWRDGHVVLLTAQAAALAMYLAALFRTKSGTQPTQ